MTGSRLAAYGAPANDTEGSGSSPTGRTTGPLTDVRHPHTSAIVVNHNGGEDLVRCARSVLTQSCDAEVIVVDNASQDGSAEYVQRELPDVRVVASPGNDGFAGGANRGAAAARGDILLFLNPDVELTPGCIAALTAALARGTAGVVAPAVRHTSQGTTEYGGTVDLLADPVGLTRSGRPLYVPGCALAITRRLFEALGGFDASFFMFCEDLDLCWRALLTGRDVEVLASALALHRGGGSTPGGYIRGGRVEVTAFRIALRERNTLATVLKCAPTGWLCAVVPARLLRIALLMTGSLLVGRIDLARSLAAGAAWNGRRLPVLLEQRRSVGATAGMRADVLGSRMLRQLNSVRVVRRYGLPRFVDRDQ